MRATFFLGELNPAMSSLSVRYFLTLFIKVSAFFLSPWKRGGSLPMALTLAAAVTGCATAVPAAAGPPPPGGPGGFPSVPPPHSPIATLRSSSNSYAVRGCCGVMAVAV